MVDRLKHGLFRTKIDRASLIVRIPTNVECDICRGWGTGWSVDYSEAICPVCSKEGIYPIPLTEFYEDLC